MHMRYGSTARSCRAGRVRVTTELKPATYVACTACLSLASPFDSPFIPPSYICECRESSQTQVSQVTLGQRRSIHDYPIHPGPSRSGPVVLGKYTANRDSMSEHP